MIGREWEDLLQDELDGTNTPERSARLRAWLETSPEGRERRRELEAMFGTLAKIGRETAPPGLRADVLAAIEADAARSPAAGRWRDSLAGLWTRHPVLRWAYPVAAVAVLLFAGAALLGRGPASRAPLPVSGTMAPGAVPVRVDAASLDAGGARLGVETWRAGDEVRLVVAGPPARGARLVVSWDPAALALRDVSWPAAPGRAETANGRLTLTLDGPAPALRFRALGPGDAPLGLEYRPGINWAGATLHTSEAPPR